MTPEAIVMTFTAGQSAYLRAVVAEAIRAYTEAGGVVTPIVLADIALDTIEGKR